MLDKRNKPTIFGQLTTIVLCWNGSGACARCDASMVGMFESMKAGSMSANSLKSFFAECQAPLCVQSLASKMQLTSKADK